MTDQQTIERLAKFAGHETDGEYDCRDRSLPCKIGTYKFRFRPYHDWNHFRVLEEKVMEDEELWIRYLDSLIIEGKINDDTEIPKSDLPTRCKAVASILPND